MEDKQKQKWEWLAEVRAPAGKDSYHLSTGVPLSRRYVLTTAHGIPESVSDKVQVRFIHDVRQSNCNWRDAKVVWRGGEDLDAVLLKIPEVENLVSFIYSNRLPIETTDWEGSGFPAAKKVSEGELKGHRDTTGLNGKFMPGGNLKSGELDLTVEAGPDDPGKWAGISGAPVLCQGRLIGIIKSLPGDFGGKRFSAVPLWRLLEMPGFCEKIEFEDRQALLDATKKRAEQLLENESEVLNALLETKTMFGAVAKPHPVVEKLFGMDLEAFGKTINWARESKRLSKASQREVLDQLLNLVLPHLFDYAMVASARQHIQGGVLVRLPIATRTVAEIFMAGTDRRPTSFRQPVSGDDFPVGSRLIENPPEMGLLAQPAEMAATVEKMLKEKYVSQEDLDKNLPDAEIRRLINGELAYLADIREGDRHRHYYICEDADNPLMRQVIAILKSYYDQIIFIALEGGALSQERGWARPLRDIYREKPGDQHK